MISHFSRVHSLKIRDITTFRHTNGPAGEKITVADAGNEVWCTGMIGVLIDLEILWMAGLGWVANEMVMLPSALQDVRISCGI